MPSRTRGLPALVLKMGKELRMGSVWSPASPSLVPSEVQELPTQNTLLFTVRDEVAQPA